MRKSSRKAGTEIARGKTKIVTAGTEPGTVLITSLDDITAGDGARRSKFDGKGVLATRMTVAVFRYLMNNGVPTHFISNGVDCNKNQFIAHSLHMIPVEVVIRYAAAGSYLKRNLLMKSGQKLDRLVVEFFWKDDKRHDPMMVIDVVGQRILFFDPSKPMSDGFLGQESAHQNFDIRWTMLKKLVEEGVEMAKTIFALLWQAFNERNVLLVDAKFEFGYDRFGHLILGDVVDNDSWRTWPRGDSKRAFDK